MPLAVWDAPSTGIGVPPAPVAPERDLRYTHGLIVYAGRSPDAYNFRERETVWNNAGWGPSRVPVTLSTVQAGEIDYAIGRDDAAFPWVLRPIYPLPTSANRPVYFELDLQSMKGVQPYVPRVIEPGYGPPAYSFP